MKNREYHINDSIYFGLAAVPAVLAILTLLAVGSL
jgi:hypothetical protein